MFAPFAGRTAAPGLQIGPFTNYGGKTYIGLLITNATATNIYQIQPMPALFNNLPFVGSITGAYGQSNFWFEVGPESAMFFRALDCVDCDGDGVLDWKDGNPSDTNVSGLTITILSPTNGATVY